MPPAVVPDNKEVVAWFDGPPEARIGAEITGVGVVLDVARQDQIRGEGVDRLELPQVERSRRVPREPLAKLPISLVGGSFRARQR